MISVYRIAISARSIFSSRGRVLGAGVALIWAASLPGSLRGQWTNGTNINNTNSGNVGIGTTTPVRKLDVVDGSSVFQMRFSAGSNEGGLGADPNGFFRMVGTIGGAFGTGSPSQGTFTEVMRIWNGNVGIGTNNPQRLLHVAGTIGAEEVIVSPTGADYVFAPDYRLQPLSEVADYVRQNRHLPEIPSAAEAHEKGVGLGEMQTKLLAKIEELTLHMIQAEERNNRLEQELQSLMQNIAASGTAQGGAR